MIAPSSRRLGLPRSRSPAKATNDLTAYDLYLRALTRFYSMTRGGLEDALRFLYAALEIDERYGVAASLASVCHGYNIAQGWSADPRAENDEAMRLARLALSLDENDPDTLAWTGRQTAYSTGDYELAIEMVDRAVAQNPNSAVAWAQRGWTYHYSGRWPESLKSFERAIRLSPLDLMLYSTLTGMAMSFTMMGRYEEALVAVRRAIRQKRNSRRRSVALSST